MKLQDLLRLVGEEPVFASSLLLAGAVSPAATQLQLGRWVKAGKLTQLRRGWYALAEPYAKASPHPFLVANRICRPSYVSLQSALAWHGLIPEYVPVVTSVTTGRPRQWRTALGDYLYRHVKTAAFCGYRRVEVQPGGFAFVASPEKCLLDLIHLTPGADAWPYLRELRLQNLTTLDAAAMTQLAHDWGSPKLQRAAARLRELREQEA